MKLRWTIVSIFKPFIEFRLKPIVAERIDTNKQIRQALKPQAHKISADAYSRTLIC